MNVKWFEPTPAGGRLSNKESDVAWATGVCRAMDSNVMARHQNLRRACLTIAFGTLLSLCLGACKKGPLNLVPAAWNTPTSLPKPVELLGGDVLAQNYTPWYIHSFVIEGPAGSRISGSGPNVMPMHEDGRPSGGGAAVCCMTFPLQWQPDLRPTVRWLADKKQDGKTEGYWYKAENVQIAQYDGRNAGEVWAVFLPGDRVRIMITDGNLNGGNNVNNRPADDDPYIAQGVLDDEWNRLYRDRGDEQ